MVAWWPLNEPAGSTVVSDIIGNVMNHGSPKAGGSVGWGSGPAPTSGMVGGALYFYTPNFVEVPDDPTDLAFGTGDFSIDAWVNLVTCGQQVVSPIVDKYDPASGVGYSFFILGGQLCLKMNNVLLNTPPVVPNNTWTHVAVTVNRTGATPSATFYVNGNVVATSTDVPTASLDNHVPLGIGKARAIPDGAFCCCEITIDELELFRRELSSAEIQGIVNAGSSGKCQPQPNAGRIIARVGPQCFNGASTITFNVYDANQNLVAQGTPDPTTGLWDSGCVLPCPATYTIVQ